ncbi:MAG: hypothetical protein DWQ36_18855 [Acidobacteria bacterium]|nr:MAG: hypothetical protein DWQ36_18855 [Acidobacteriota bacterium]
MALPLLSSSPRPHFAREGEDQVAVSPLPPSPDRSPLSPDPFSPSPLSPFPFPLSLFPFPLPFSLVPFPFSLLPFPSPFSLLPTPPTSDRAARHSAGPYGRPEGPSFGSLGSDSRSRRSS